jgi:hypothetical protein
MNKTVSFASGRRRLLSTLLVGTSLVQIPLMGAETSSGKAQLTPVRQALTHLMSADALLKSGQLAAAKAEFASVAALAGVYQHQVLEARQRIQEIERQEAGLPAFDINATRLHLKPVPQPALTLHVSPTGDDGNEGSSAKPLASLEGARDRLRSLRKADPLPAGSIVVLIHQGDYRVARTFQLSPKDSGSEVSPVIYRAAPGEEPRFTGGVRLQKFSQVVDADLLKTLPPPARGKATQVDLRGVGVTNLLPLELGGFASGRGFKTHPAHELFFNGKAMGLARGPNQGFLHIADVEVKDGTKGYDREGSKIGRFLYRGELPGPWEKEPDLLLYGYWFWDWADSYERVASIDTKKKLISLTEPWHTYGYSIGAPFYAVNALCELDVPGEYYLDRQQMRLVFYPPSDPSEGRVELSVFPELMVQLDGVSHVRFEGLTWELGCNDAIHVNSGSNCVFAGCVLRHFAGTGIEMNGGESNGLLSCDIYSLGRGGIVLRGGDRRTLARSGHFIENCDIHDLSRIDHTYTPAVACSGVGHHIAHNRFHEILSSALNVGGNDHVVEYNEVFHVVQESDDQGGVDMFGNPTFRGNIYRFNYWHHIGNWQAVGEQPKCGQAGIRLDDAICGTLVYGNVFERCSTGKNGFGAVQIHGGRDNIIDNNLFIDCAAAVSFSPWDLKRWQNHVTPYLTNQEINLTLYLERYPALGNLGEIANTNTVYRSLLVRCGEMLRHSPGTIDLAENTVSPDADSTLRPDSPVLNRPGFARIPVEAIGLYVDEFRRRLEQGN